MAQRAPALVQAFEILRVISSRAEPLTAGQIAQRTGLARSTTYYLLEVLEQYGYVVHYPDRRGYGLGMTPHELASASRRQAPIRRLAGPILEALVATTGESGQFAVLDGTDVVYLVSDPSPTGSPLISDVGVHLPAHLTASGLALLSLLPLAQLRVLYPSAEAFTTRLGTGPASPSQLRSALSQTRQRGYAVEHGFVVPGLASVSAAAADGSGSPIGSFTLTFQERPGVEEEVAARVTAAAETLSRSIGAAGVHSG